jgi:hypothetical protein
LGDGKHEIENQVVIKDRMLDTVAVGHLTWTVETKDA